jgi:aspartate kinase
MGIKVAKFGGTSLADASQFKKVQAIIQADKTRQFVVPSAPGKRSSEDRKITDLLYLCHAHAQQRISFDDVFGLIASRYEQIVKDLGLKIDLAPYLKATKEGIAKAAETNSGPDFAASRGEYLNGLIMAELLGFPFVDAAEVVFFNARGQFDSEKTQKVLSERLSKMKNAVVPGFYGSTPDGKIKTFSRGGSDISGAIVARAAHAEVYENWTDVSGLLMTDPRVVKNPRPIQTVTYRELRELAYMGATVLHDEAIFPVREAGIPVNIRNTNKPEDVGTFIVPEVAPDAKMGVITGIAGRKDFTVIAVEKSLMNQEIGFGRRLLSVLEVNQVSFEHMPSGIDTISLVISDKQLEGKLEKVVEDIKNELKPDSVDVYPDMALVATVGRGMAYHPGIAAKLFDALFKAGINVRMIDQGSSEINIIVGIQNSDFDNACRAIYKAFVD